MWPEAPLAHVRQQPHGQADGAEVVQLHRALEVVEAVLAERDRAADRAPGVVDQHVDGDVLVEDLLDEVVDRVEVREVGRVDVRGAPGRLDLGLGLLELVHRARDEQRDAAGRRDLHRRRAADAARGAGDDDGAPVDGGLERAVLVEVGVELALPVVPDELGVVLAAAGPRSPEPASARSVSRVSNWAVKATWLEDLLGDPEVGEDRAPHALQRRQLQQQRADALGQRVGQALVDADRDAAARGRPWRTC